MAYRDRSLFLSLGQLYISLMGYTVDRKVMEPSKALASPIQA